MTTIKHTMRKIRKETDGLFAFVLLPVLALIAWLALLPKLPAPVAYVLLTLVLPVATLVVNLIAD